MTRDVVLPEVANDVEHLLAFAHAERGGRLVEDDDPAAPEQRARDGKALPLPARHAFDADIDRRNLHRERIEHLARALPHGAVVDEVEHAQRPRLRRAVRGRDRRSGRRSSCRPAPGPGRPSRSRHPSRPARAGSGSRGPRGRSGRHPAGSTPERIFSSVDFPAPLSPTSPKTSRCLRATDASASATTAPKRRAMRRASSTGASIWMEPGSGEAGEIVADGCIAKAPRLSCSTDGTTVPLLNEANNAPEACQRSPPADRHRPHGWSAVIGSQSVSHHDRIPPTSDNGMDRLLPRGVVFKDLPAPARRSIHGYHSSSCLDWHRYRQGSLPHCRKIKRLALIETFKKIPPCAVGNPAEGRTPAVPLPSLRSSASPSCRLASISASAHRTCRARCRAPFWAGHSRQRRADGGKGRGAPRERA